MNSFEIKYSSEFERDISGIKTKSILECLANVIIQLKKDPYVREPLRNRLSHSRTIYVSGRFRLYYQVWDTKRIVLLRRFYPRNLQDRVFKGEA